MNKTMIISGLLLAATTLSSCTVYETVKDKLGFNRVKKEVVLPQDREEILKDKDAKTYTSEDIARGILKGDWVIESVTGKEAVGEEAPYLKFVPADKHIYGYNGCNVINAKYNYNPADSTLTFDNVLSTMRMCSKSGITDIEINTALANTRRYITELRADSQFYLYFYDASGSRVMTLMHQNFDFLNGTWRVVAINEEAVNIPDMKLVIDVDEGKVHGNTGCNILNGDLDTEMETPNSISFSAIATTRRACQDNSYETPLLVALEDATYARPISAEKVLLLNAQNEVVLELAR